MGEQTFNEVTMFFQTVKKAIETKNMDALMAQYSDNYRDGDIDKKSIESWFTFRPISQTQIEKPSFSLRQNQTNADRFPYAPDAKFHCYGTFHRADLHRSALWVA
ncbi:MAG: hypothetical protein HY935_04460 [Nitrosomonadales bacterium]|nr:hypothetical protein [Nitrosomonadales bacterium]